MEETEYLATDEMIQHAISIHNNGRLSDAAEEYQALLKFFPKHPQLLTGLGTVYLQLYQVDLGIMLLEQSLDADPRQIIALSNLGIGLASLGRYAEALVRYDSAIAINPGYADAYNNRGLALHGLEQFEAALESFHRAIALEPAMAEAYYNRANTLVALKRFSAALANYEQAIFLKPESASFHNNRGNALKELNRFEDAIASYDRAISLKANYPEAFNNRGIAQKSLQQYEAALLSYNQAIRIKSDYAEAHNNMGIVWHELQQFDKALESFEHAINLQADYAEAYFNRGNTFRDLQQFEPALACYERAIALKADFAEAYCNHGNALQELKKTELALLSFDKALALKANFADAYNNRGNALKELKRPAEAVEHYDKAIALKADFAEAYYNRGQALFDLQEYAAASASYDKAIELDADFTKAYWNNALLKILIGEYEKGWKLYEWRWKNPAIANKYGVFPNDFWLGRQSLRGKVLLIKQEQGFGDFIQFCRYAAIASSQAAHIIIEVPSALFSLVSTLEGNFTLIEQGMALPEFDFYCPLMSMPLIFKTTLDNIPAKVPYLFVDADKQKFWQQYLGQKTVNRIGLVWAGSKDHSNDQNRSMPCNFLEPLLKLPLEFHILQQQVTQEDADFLAAYENVYHHQEKFADFSDTAALTNEMDLIISVDTSVAHLAGALAKPVWILLPYAPDFRWMLARSDSPWYPTATLIRQSTLGNWTGVVSEVIQRIKFF